MYSIPHFLEQHRKPSKLFCLISILLLMAKPACADLPAGWSDTDIGSPGLAGSASYANGNWPVTGGRLDDCHEMTKRFSHTKKPLRVGLPA